MGEGALAVLYAAAECAIREVCCIDKAIVNLVHEESAHDSPRSSSRLLTAFTFTLPGHLVEIV